MDISRYGSTSSEVHGDFVLKRIFLPYLFNALVKGRVLMSKFCNADWAQKPQ